MDRTLLFPLSFLFYVPSFLSFQVKFTYSKMYTYVNVQLSVLLPVYIPVSSLPEHSLITGDCEYSLVTVTNLA